MENQINYTVGDEIVALRDHSQGIFKMGDTFICKGLYKEPCKCNTYLVDVGFSFKPNTCRVCKSNYVEVAGFKAHLFTKYDSISISEAYEVLQKEPYSL